MPKDVIFALKETSYIGGNTNTGAWLLLKECYSKQKLKAVHVKIRFPGSIKMNVNDLDSVFVAKTEDQSSAAVGFS